MHPKYWRPNRNHFLRAPLDSETSAGGGSSDSMIDAFAAHFENSASADDDQKAAPAAESQEDAAARLAAEDAAGAGDDGKDPADDATKQDDGQDADANADKQPQKFTIEVDGKPVELTAAEMADHYKAGLRLQDYTQKTMALAEQRKAAESEQTKAREQRDTYAQKLDHFAIVANAELTALQAQLTPELLHGDPVEYLDKQRIVQERQAQLAQAQRELEQINGQRQQETEQAMRTHLQSQQEQLLAKVPEWKDEGKFKVEAAKIKDYLVAQGFAAEEANFGDHRAVVLARKAMQFDALMARAKDAQTRVAKAPPRVERPGTPAQASEGRSTAVRRFEQTGSRDDAAKAFAEMFG
jgi:hypothetical protein